MPFVHTGKGFKSLEEAPLGTIYHHPGRTEMCPAVSVDVLPERAFVSLGTPWMYAGKPVTTSVTCLEIPPKTDRDVGAMHSPYDSKICILKWVPE